MGPWIDHKQAVIVVLAGKQVKIKRIDSGIRKHVRYRGGALHGTRGSGQFFTPEIQKDRQFREHLRKFYDEVIHSIREADALLIFGPGQARLELEKQLSRAGFRGWVVGIESVGRMTSRRIAAKVLGTFQGQLI